MNKLAKILIAIFLPPVAVALDKGIGKTFLINLVLTCLFFVPGIIHAIVVIS